MNILFCSHHFSPSLGGIELNSLMLATEFAALGHSVCLVTQTPSKEKDCFPFEVIRSPSPMQLLACTRWAHVVFHNNISLQTAWPLLLTRKTWIVSHHTWIRRQDKSLSWQDHLKRQLLKYAHGISNSEAVAKDVSVPSLVISPPYRDYLFHRMPEVSRDKEIVFLARLVSDKGGDILLRALGLLRTNGLAPQVTIIGEGPEKDILWQLARDLHLDDKVRFIGTQKGSDLVHALNEHYLMVVPSRWPEPFGIVAIEGIACGCVVVGSEEGGLKDAIGPCGATFPNGDVVALAYLLTDLLTHPEKLKHYQEAADLHLAKHLPRAVAEAHIRVFEAAVR